MAHDFAFREAAELAELIRAKQISPVELMRATLDRIESVGPSLNCFVTVCGEDALDAARAAEQAVMNGAAVGPLHGVPFAVKDMVQTANVATSYGCLPLRDNVPKFDELPVRRLKQAGGILVGKTTSPEFAHTCKTESPLYGRTINPWNNRLIAGGSSGGSAVALAAGLVPLAIGTDSGGSSRIPAACNAVVGIKQTLGLVPDDAALDVFNSLISTNPMARTSRDVALMLSVMSGPDASDPFSLARPATRVTDDLWTGDLRGLRIARMPVRPGQVFDAEVARAFEESLRIFAAAGAAVISPDARDFYQDVEAWEAEPDAWTVMQGSLRLVRYADTIERFERYLSQSFVDAVRVAEGFSRTDYQNALVVRARLFAEVQRWFEQYDLVVMPTTTGPAISVDHDLREPISLNGEPVGNVHRHWFPDTHAFNMTGHPALAVPNGWTTAGDPIGLQIVGGWGADSIALKAGHALSLAIERRRPVFAPMDVELIAARGSRLVMLAEV